MHRLAPFVVGAFPGEPGPAHPLALGEVDDPLALVRGATFGLGLMALCALVVLGIVAWPQVLAWLGWP